MQPAGNRAARRQANAKNRPRSTAAAPTIRLDDEWHRWIAENLLLGATPDQLVVALAGSGVTQTMAEAEIASALASPYLKGAALLQARLAKRDWILNAFASLATIDGDLGEVPHADALPADRFFTEYYATNRPVLLRGLIDHWPARTRWSLDDFEARLGDAAVQVQAGRESDEDYELRSPDHRQSWRFGDVIERMRSGGRSNDFYLTANNGDHNRVALNALWADVGDIPGYVDPQPGRDGFFWMGPEGTITPFHHDLTNNLLLQIRGSKRVTMVPSWETPRMRNTQHCFSAYRTPADIAAAPPEIRPATTTCTIAPGEILFIPLGWWHHVEGLTPTIGMSFTNFARKNDFSATYTTYGAL